MGLAASASNAFAEDQEDNFLAESKKYTTTSVQIEAMAELLDLALEGVCRMN